MRHECGILTPLQAGGVPKLVSLLTAGPDSEITEYAAAALGNLAAGGHALKDAIRGVRLMDLATCPNEREGWQNKKSSDSLQESCHQELGDMGRKGGGACSFTVTPKSILGMDPSLLCDKLSMTYSMPGVSSLLSLMYPSQPPLEGRARKGLSNRASASFLFPDL